MLKQQYLSGTYSVFGRQGPIRPLPEIIDVEPISEAKPVERNPLENAKHLINAYTQEVFGQDADFSDLSHVDLAYGSTSDSEYTVEIFADLSAFRLVYQVDHRTVHELTCKDLQEILILRILSDLDQLHNNGPGICKKQVSGPKVICSRGNE